MTTLKQKNKKSQKGTTAQSVNTDIELKTQGTTIDSTATDSTSIKQGSKTDEIKKPSTGHNLLMWIIIPIMLVVSAFIFIKLFKK